MWEGSSRTVVGGESWAQWGQVLSSRARRCRRPVASSSQWEPVRICARAVRCCRRRTAARYGADAQKTFTFTPHLLPHPGLRAGVGLQPSRMPSHKPFSNFAQNALPPPPSSPACPKTVGIGPGRDQRRPWGSARPTSRAATAATQPPPAPYDGPGLPIHPNNAPPSSLNASTSPGARATGADRAAPSGHERARPRPAHRSSPPPRPPCRPLPLL